jgi:hypothetical protein
MPHYVADYPASEAFDQRRVELRVALNSRTWLSAAEEMARLHLEADGADGPILTEVGAHEWEAASSAPNFWPTDEVDERTVSPRAKALERYGSLITISFAVATLAVHWSGGPKRLVLLCIFVSSMISIPTGLLTLRRRRLGE